LLQRASTKAHEGMFICTLAFHWVQSVLFAISWTSMKQIHDNWHLGHKCLAITDSYCS
jgi:hypothetical protein